MTIKRKRVRSLLVLTLFMLAISSAELHAQGNTTSVKGYVLDSACAFIKNLKKPVSSDCAVACAKAGSPLVILADDGTLYWPISSSMPATGQNERLMNFAGQRVTASGSAYEKGGSHALVIEKIEAAPAGK
jgi:hypothetical protein